MVWIIITLKLYNNKNKPPSHVVANQDTNMKGVIHFEARFGNVSIVAIAITKTITWILKKGRHEALNENYFMMT